MLIGKAVLICLQVLPMTVMLMYIVPANIEASCFAVITAILTFSTDWAGDVVGAFICESFNISVKDMSNYSQVIILKMGLISIACLMIGLLPTNAEVQEIGAKMNDLQNESTAESDDDKSTRSLSEEIQQVLQTEA